MLDLSEELDKIKINEELKRTSIEYLNNAENKCLDAILKYAAKIAGGSLEHDRIYFKAVFGIKPKLVNKKLQLNGFGIKILSKLNENWIAWVNADYVVEYDIENDVVEFAPENYSQVELWKCSRDDDDDEVLVSLRDAIAWSIKDIAKEWE